MDNGNFPDLGQLLYALKDNPQLLQMLMSMMSTPQKNEPRPPANDLMSLLSGMQNNGSSPPPSEKSGNSKCENGFWGATQNDSILGSNEENAKRINLLNAVRPYLSESRQARLDTVIKLLKIAGIGGLSKILGGK
jgi:hypothetical protein